MIGNYLFAKENTRDSRLISCIIIKNIFKIYLFIYLSWNLVWSLGKISGPLNAHLRKRGILVFNWVLNDEGDFQNAIKVILIFFDIFSKLDKLYLFFN